MNPADVFAAEQLWWWVSRATGIVALVCLAASVLWGLVLHSRFLGSSATAASLLDLHRWLAGLTVASTLAHMGALVADSFVSFTVADLLVPFASEWKPGPVAWGVLSFWLLAAVQLTSLLRRHVPPKVWRGVHLTSYLALAGGMVHAITAGTDADHPVAIVGLAAITGLVAALTAWRSLVDRSAPVAA